MKSDLTPKKVYMAQTGFPQTTIQTKYVPMPVYHTPEKITKSPYRNHAVTTHSFIETQDFQRQPYPPTYQSSQLKDFTRDLSPITTNYHQEILNLKNELMKMKAEKLKVEDEKERYRQCYLQTQRDRDATIIQLTDRNKQLQEKLNSIDQRDSHQQLVQMMKEQLNKLNQQFEESKIKIQEQDNRIGVQEQKLKQQKQQLKMKEKELVALFDELKATNSKFINQQKMKEYIDEQLKHMKIAYEEISKLNDDIQDENVQLKMKLLLFDKPSTRQQSEQDFQKNDQQESHLKVMLDQFLIGNSEDVLDLSEDENIKSLFLLFRDTFNRVLNLSKDSQFHEVPSRLSQIQSAAFPQSSFQQEQVVEINELKAKGKYLQDQINEKQQQLKEAKDKKEQNILLEEISELEKQYEGIQLVIGDQQMPHRNSAVSFDQNFFDVEHHQPY